MTCELCDGHGYITHLTFTSNPDHIDEPCPLCAEDERELVERGPTSGRRFAALIALILAVFIILGVAFP